MSYLGLEKAPLVLDELGAKLDSAHRQSVQFEITNLITTSNFSQVFMVSHYENAYGSLNNADICVLHPSNINIPKNMAYNTHVKMS
jgi:ABC-type nitrate/sulfonate/bicarbonate transport system ATPase subunit